MTEAFFRFYEMGDPKIFLKKEGAFHFMLNYDLYGNVPGKI